MAKKTKPKTPTKVKKTQESETKIKKKQALTFEDFNDPNPNRDFIRSKSTALQEDVQINPPIKKNKQRNVSSKKEIAGRQRV